MDDLGRPDRGKVAVALIGEHERVRADPANAGRDRGRAAVRSLDEVDRQVVVGEDAAADRGDRDRRGSEVHLVEQLGDEAVDDAVAAAGAVVGGRVGQQVRSSVDDASRVGGLDHHRGHPAFPSVAPCRAASQAPSSIRLSGSGFVVGVDLVQDGRRSDRRGQRPGPAQDIHDLARRRDHAARPAVEEDRGAPLDGQAHVLDHLPGRHLERRRWRARRRRRSASALDGNGQRLIGRNRPTRRPCSRARSIAVRATRAAVP